MKRIRVGIIGQGRSGHNIHARTLVKLVADRYQVVAVADPAPRQLESDLLDAATARHQDYRELLRRKDLDLVVNASPSHLHVPITLEALDAGHAVLCEKPFARRAAEVDQVMERARTKGRFLAVFQQSRFAPYFQQARSVMHSGALGRIVMVKIAWGGFSRRWDWQTVQEYNGGSLLNTGPHPVDHALQIFGTDRMPEVFATMDGATSFGDAEDTVKVILRGAGRPTIDLEISSCAVYTPYNYQVNGTHGSLTGTMRHLEWKYFKSEEAPKQVLTREPLVGRTWCSESLAWHEGHWDFPGDEEKLYDTMAQAFYTSLYGSLVEGAPLAVSLQEVRQQIAVIEECHRQNPRPRR